MAHGEYLYGNMYAPFHSLKYWILALIAMEHNQNIKKVFNDTLNSISRSSQCSMTGITNAVVCAILSVGLCI